MRTSFSPAMILTVRNRFSGLRRVRVLKTTLRLVASITIYTVLLQVVLYYWYGVSCSPFSGDVSPYASVNISYNIDHRRRIASQIGQVRHHLTLARDEGRNVSWRIELELLRLVDELDPLFLPDLRPPPLDPDQLTDACPEHYVGFDKGTDTWVSTSCSRVRPLEDVVTVLFNLCAASPQVTARLTTALSDLRAIYPRLSVLVATCRPRDGRMIEAAEAVIVDGARSMADGWNRLTDAVKTKYALLARDVTHVTSDWRLQRLVAALVVAPSAGLAAGSLRNLTGHWRAGCWQAQLTNYNLRLREGYEISNDECMLCDIADGPFLARTDLLKKVAFNPALPTQVMFEDWFLRVKVLGREALVCPDSMFYTQPSSLSQPTRRHWKQLAQNWYLHVVDEVPGERHVFRCSEVNITCSGLTEVEARPAHLAPPCCLSPLCRMMRKLSQFFRVHQLRHLLGARSTLAAVLYSVPLQWQMAIWIDVEPDAIKKLLLPPHRSQDSWRLLAGFQMRQSESGLLVVESAEGVQVKLRPVSQVPEMFVQLEFCGMKVPARVNPVEHVLNSHGGVDVFNHRQHWRHLGLPLRPTIDGAESVGVSAPPCHPPRHNCLVQMELDGTPPFVDTYALYIVF